jgi:hypothetical protein
VWRKLLGTSLQTITNWFGGWAQPTSEQILDVQDFLKSRSETVESNSLFETPFSPRGCRCADIELHSFRDSGHPKESAAADLSATLRHAVASPL